MAKGSGHIGRKVATAASILLIAAGIALAGGVAWMNDRADNVPASPRGVAADGAGGIECPWEFEEVDWEGWGAENPDVIGWVQMPGTDISLPVAAADAENPDFYLHHDVYGNWNFAGVPYLDAECEGDFDCGIAVIYGHHLNNGTVFSVLAEYSDQSFAEEHPHILLQTRDWKRVYEVEYAEVVNASVPTKRCTFASTGDFREYLEAGRGRADAVLKDASPARMCALQLVTCSYSTYRNERTVVTATVAEEYR